VGYVTEAGATTDGAIGEHLYQGFVRAVRELGVDGHVLQASPGRALDTALATFGRQRFELIIAGSFLQGPPVGVAARRFPRSKFFYVGGPANTLDKQLENVRGLVIHVEQAGYLACYLAALVEAQRRGKHVVAAVGGSAQVPDVENYIGDYRAGARNADPSVKPATPILR
jgi:basic membrane lipoprotein Med (substrate-binding protein (PBP1-ABC) superfamily)